MTIRMDGTELAKSSFKQNTGTVHPLWGLIEALSSRVAMGTWALTSSRKRGKWGLPGSLCHCQSKPLSKHQKQQEEERWTQRSF